ncbi:MAG: RloB family protein [Ruminococcus flavefaciens]|nr:RloB family protein [Ruminococcus flavefaciens]
MARTHNAGSVRKMKPIILVLCEGETEECYVEFLKRRYRLPIKIVSKVIGQKINERLIGRILSKLKLNASERIDCFLMYDADVATVVKNIQSCKNAIALFSRPCLEVWFLAHSDFVSRTDFSTADCLRKLKNISAWRDYRKGFLTAIQQELLWQNRHSAARKQR